jgi:hypothetical protein
MDLQPGVFAQRSARDIARSIKRSAERSHARKADPYRSALSMISFYINRAGRRLDPVRRRRLERAKQELRTLFSGTQQPRRRSPSAARSPARRAARPRVRK